MSGTNPDVQRLFNPPPRKPPEQTEPHAVPAPPPAEAPKTDDEAKAP